MKQIRVVFDNPPKENDGWAVQACSRAKLMLVSNGGIAKLMSKDEASRKRLLEVKAPVNEAEQVAGLYHAALQRLYGKDERLGLYSTAWLVYSQPEPVGACIVDWSEIEARASAPSVPADPGENFRQMSRAFVMDRVKKYVPEGRFLELALGLKEAEKVEQSVKFLKTLGLCD